jgi:hypothetical protein
MIIDAAAIHATLSAQNPDDKRNQPKSWISVTCDSATCSRQTTQEVGAALAGDCAKCTIEQIFYVPFLRCLEFRAPIFTAIPLFNHRLSRFFVLQNNGSNITHTVVSCFNDMTQLLQATRLAIYTCLWHSERLFRRLRYRCCSNHRQRSDQTGTKRTN